MDRRDGASKGGFAYLSQQQSLVRPAADPIAVYNRRFQGRLKNSTFTQLPLFPTYSHAAPRLLALVMGPGLSSTKVCAGSRLLKHVSRPRKTLV